MGDIQKHRFQVINFASNNLIIYTVGRTLKDAWQDET